MGSRDNIDELTSERAAIVWLAFGTRRCHAVEATLEELRGLAVSAGATVVHCALQERPKPDPAFFLGRSKTETLATACAETDVDLVIFDGELTPGGLRNLKKTLGRRVVDRTQLIPDILASRARTCEGRLQVELTQLRYLLLGLSAAGVARSRLSGGIGTRGPGETKLESDRRRSRGRIARLTRELDTVGRRRPRSRACRHKDAVPRRLIEQWRS